MDAIKQYMQPKWWLIVVGCIFTIMGLMTYMNGEGSAKTAWGDTVTDNDVFYEKAWAATFFLVALITIVSGQFVEGRAQAILAITIGGGNIFIFLLTVLAAGDLGYGYTDSAANWGLPMICAICMLVSGFLHLEEE